MMNLQKNRAVAAGYSTGAATNADFTAIIDTLGFSEGAVNVNLAPQAATGGTTSVPTTLKLQESDDTEATNFADITGFKGGTNDAFKVTAISVGTNLPVVARANLDLRKRKRYLRVVFRPADLAQAILVTAELSKAKDSTVARSAGMGVVKDG